MKMKKVFAVMISFVMVVSMALPVALAVSDTQEAGDGVAVASTEPGTPTVDAEEPADDTEAPAEEEKEGNASSEVERGEEESEPVKECTCDPKPAEGEAHETGCPLYVKVKTTSFYERLMAAETAEEFMAIAEQTTEEERNALTCEEFDNANARYIFLITGKYPDYSPVVDEVMEIVNYTYVAPFGAPVSGGNH